MGKSPVSAERGIFLSDSSFVRREGLTVGGVPVKRESVPAERTTSCEDSNMLRADLQTDSGRARRTRPQQNRELNVKYRLVFARSPRVHET